MKHTSTSFVVAAIYVDDIILTGNDTSLIHRLKAHLHKVFSIKDLCKLSFFLGIEVSYLDVGIVLSQKKFTSKLLHDSGITYFKRPLTPLLFILSYIILAFRSSMTLLFIDAWLVYLIF